MDTMMWAAVLFLQATWLQKIDANPFRDEGVTIKRKKHTYGGIVLSCYREAMKRLQEGAQDDNKEKTPRVIVVIVL